MKSLFNRIISFFTALSMCVCMLFSSFAMPVHADPITLTALLASLGYTALISFTSGAGYAVVDNAIDWYTAEDETEHGGGGTSYNYGDYAVDSTGTTYSTVYNSGDTTSYQVVNTTNNTYYNTYTETYNTYNDITYNETYNTYYITEEYYDVYIINNYTYVTYVIEDTTTSRSYYYEIYYMLPDGRSSYTLTKDDVWGEYFIYDVVNYDYVAEDDGTTIGLWHLDGDLKDSSYWNSTGSSSLSVTYDESVFTYGKYLNVAPSTGDYLYLSFENAVDDFDIFSDDWTLEYILYNYGSDSSSTYYYSGWSLTDYLSFGHSSSYSSYDGCNDFYFNGLQYDITLLGVYDQFYYCSIVCENGLLSFYLNGNLVYSSGINDSDTYDNYESRRSSSYSVMPDDYFSEMSMSTYYHSYSDFVYSDFVIDDYGYSFFSFTDDCLCFDISEILAYSYAQGYISTTFRDYTDYYNGKGYEDYYETTDYRTFYNYTVSCQSQFLLDEVRLSKGVIYDSSYTVSVVPFDTNMVMVVPEGVRDGTICVQATYDISSWRIGGVRPTYPTTGEVWVYLEDDVVTDVQQYQENGWYSVTATIYDDGVYSDLSGYDMSMYVMYEDSDDTDTDGDSSSGTTGDSDADSSDDSTDSDNWLTDLIDGFFSSIAGVLDAILSGLVDLILPILDEIVEIFSFLVTTITDLFASIVDFGGEFSSFLGIFFDWLPSEVVTLMCLSLSLPLLLAIIKFVANFFT